MVDIGRDVRYLGTGRHVDSPRRMLSAPKCRLSPLDTITCEKYTAGLFPSCNGQLDHETDLMIEYAKSSEGKYCGPEKYDGRAYHSGQGKPWKPCESLDEDWSIFYGSLDRLNRVYPRVRWDPDPDHCSKLLGRAAHNLPLI